ncbi:MAG: hypothetical protein AAGF33_00225 [Pseudomonadota bacterium]
MAQNEYSLSGLRRRIWRRLQSQDASNQKRKADEKREGPESTAPKPKPKPKPSPRQTMLSQDSLAKARAEVSKSVPHFGKELGVLSRAAYLNPRPEKAGNQYDRIKPYFDAAFYYATYPDIARKQLDPVWHYIRAGAREGRDPSPLFSTKTYLKRYPKVAKYPGTPLDHWVKYGRAEGKCGLPAFNAGMGAVLDMTHTEIQDHLEKRHADLRERLAHGELGEMVNKAAEWDPSVTKVWPAALSLRVLPFSSARITDRISSLFRLQRGLDWTDADIVILEHGLGETDPLMQPLLDQAIATVGVERVVVLRTSDRRPQKNADLPDGLRSRWLFGQFDRPPGDSRRLIVDLLFSLQPKLVIGCSSPLFHNVLRSYGNAMLSTFRILTTVPVPQVDHLGHYSHGAEVALYRFLPYIDGLICLDANQRSAVIDSYHLPPGPAHRLLTLDTVAAAGGLAAYLGPRTDKGPRQAPARKQEVSDGAL